jgi:hypothetical protein
MTVRSGMSKMTVRAHTLFEGSMNISLVHKILDAFMASQTKGTHVFFYQIFKITCMYIMTGFTLPLFKGEMYIALGKTLLKRLMTVIAEIRNLTLDAYLSIAEIAISQN